jgi:hypothetical protein
MNMESGAGRRPIESQTMSLTQQPAERVCSNTEYNDGARLRSDIGLERRNA